MIKYLKIAAVWAVVPFVCIFVALAIPGMYLALWWADLFDAWIPRKR